jgi:hypothetical protein
MEFNNVNTKIPKKQGNVGVARAVYEYTKLGYTVLAPLSDSDKYDLVVDDGSSFKKVQVKTSRKRKNNSWEVYIATSGGNTKHHTMRLREEADYDLLFILVETGECWSIPNTSLEGNSTITVGSKANKYNKFKLGA